MDGVSSPSSVNNGQDGDDAIKKEASLNVVAFDPARGELKDVGVNRLEGKRLREDFDIKSGHVKSKCPDHFFKNMDWDRFFSESPCYYYDIICNLPTEASAIICYMRIYFEKKEYSEVVRTFSNSESLKCLSGIRCSHLVIDYVKSVVMLSNINLYAQYLEDGLQKCSLPIVSGISADGYIDFLLSLAKAAKKETGLVSRSKSLEWYCYRKAADAGSHEAIKTIVVRMLFCRGSDDNLAVGPCFCKDILFLLKLISFSDAKKEKKDKYDNIIEGLSHAVNVCSQYEQEELANTLLSDKRPEVQCLASMVFLDPIFGELSADKARKFIPKLSEDTPAKNICDYWSYRADFLSGQNINNAKNNLMKLGNQGFTEAYSFLLVRYPYDPDLLTMPELIDVCNGAFCHVSLSSDLAYTIYGVLRYFSEETVFMDGLSFKKNSAQECAGRHANTSNSTDFLYSKSDGYFSIENWDSTSTEKTLPAPECFTRVLRKGTYSMSPVLYVFRHAHQVLSRSVVQGELLKKAISMDFLKSYYLMLVLNHWPDGLCAADIAHEFLKECRDSMDFLMPCIYTSSLPVFIKNLYRYGVFSDLSKEHFFFDAVNLDRMRLSQNDKCECLLLLAEIKKVHDQPESARYCYEVLKGLDFSGDVGLMLNDYYVFQSGIPDWMIKCYALMVQPHHFSADKYRFQEILEVLGRPDRLQSAYFSLQLISFTIENLYRSREFLTVDQYLMLFIRLESAIGLFQKNYFSRFITICYQLSTWLEGCSDDQLAELQQDTTNKLIDFKSLIEKRVAPSIECFPEFVMVDSKPLNKSSHYKKTKAAASESKFSVASAFSDHDYLGCPVEHHLMRAVRKETDKEKCRALLERVLSHDQSSYQELLLLAINKLVPDKSECFHLIDKIMLALDNELSNEGGVEIGLNAGLLVGLQSAIGFYEKQGVLVTGFKEILYKKLASMAVYSHPVLQRLYVNTSRETDYDNLLKLMVDGCNGSFERQLEILMGEDNLDARSLLAFAGLNCPPSEGEAVNSRIKARAKAKARVTQLFNGRYNDVTWFVIFIDLLEVNNFSRLCRWIKSGVQVNQRNFSKASSILWLGYESGFLSREEHIRLMKIFYKDSSAYYFHSVLTENNTDAPVFVGLQSEKKLETLPKPQLEAIAMKLIEMGQIADAAWLATKAELKAVYGALAWSFKDSSIAPCKEGNDSLSEAPIENMLISGAMTGHCLAQCRLVEWVLTRYDQWGSGTIDRLLNICCFCIHTPSISTDNRRLFYQGVALCAGIAGHKDPDAGKVKIRAALDSQDPAVLLILHAIQRFFWLKLPGIKGDLPLLFLNRLPDGLSGKLLVEMLLLVGEERFRHMVSEIKESVKQSDDIDKLRTKAQALSCWLNMWSEQIRFQKMSHTEKLIYQFNDFAGKGWPVQNLPVLQGVLEQSSKSYICSEAFQDQLISFVKKLSRLSDAHKNFAGFLYNNIERDNRYRLLLNDDGGRRLYWNSSVFDRENKLSLYRAMPPNRREKLLQSLVKEIRSREQLTQMYGEKRRVDKSRMPAILLVELIKEVESKGIDITSAALGKRIKTFPQQENKKYTYHYLLKILVVANNSELSPQTIEAFRTAIRDMANESLQDPVKVEDEVEVLSKAAIYTWT